MTLKIDKLESDIKRARDGGHKMVLMPLDQAQDLLDEGRDWKARLLMMETRFTALVEQARKRGPVARWRGKAEAYQDALEMVVRLIGNRR